MANDQPSLIFSSVRAFFVTFFGVVGIAVAFILIMIGIYALSSLAEEDTFPASVKIMPDAHGNRKELSASTPVLLEVHFNGTIGSDSLTADKIDTILLKSREKELKEGRVKGLLLVINSPGGGANDSDVIYRLIQQYKQQFKVPVYAYVSGLCASGGYYIACAADKILTTDVSVIGSVGVLSWPPFFNVTDPIKKLGIETVTLSAGKGKDEMNPLRPWKTDEQESYQHLLNYFYDRFVDVVVSNRPMITKEKLIEEYGAKVFPATEAKERGYIDEVIVTKREAVHQLALAAGIAEDQKYQVIAFESKGWVKQLLEERSPLLTGKVSHEIDWNSSLKPQANRLFEYSFKP